MHAETLNGYVIEITDGDTIVALDANHKQRKIRLAGIDAPEKANSEKAPETAQPFGERSKQNLASIVQQECCCRMEQAGPLRQNRWQSDGQWHRCQLGPDQGRHGLVVREIS